jgi:ATP-binding cassette subfamily C (CFTR/MRP) protein 4
MMPQSGPSFTTIRRPSNPLTDASLISKLTFRWAYAPLLKVGNERPLEESDLPELQEEDTSYYQRQHVEKLWKQTKDKHHSANSLERALLRDYFQSTWLAQILLVIQMASRIGQAIALGYLLQTFEDGGIETNSSLLSSGFFWVFILIACGLVSFPAKQLQFFETYRKGMRIRVGLVAAIYAKILRLPSLGALQTHHHDNPKQESSSPTSSGQITNLASNDVERFLSTSVSSIYLIYGPLEAIAVVLTGIYTVGPSFASGVLFLVAVLIPLQFYLSRRFVALRSQVATRTDARVNWISQAVAGARVVKYNGWELELQKRIERLRNDELDGIQTSTRYKACNEAMYYVASLTISVVIFVVDVFLVGNPLNARKVFTTLSLNNILQMTVTRLITNAIMGLSECHVSSQRIQAFLQLAELQDTTNNDAPNDTTEIRDDDIMLSMKSVCCFWNSAFDDQAEHTALDDYTTAIADVSLDFQAGNLYTVIGKVGCGKSALLLALSGELQATSGHISRQYRSLAYVQQEPWIMNGTIRDNIVMGREFHPSWYDTIIHACGLIPDLQTFANSDATIVGDRGVQCSGGQKARIGLARALYGDAEVVLLDDPISAVDSRVAKHIYRSAIQELCVQRGKCVVLVTHQHRFIGNDSTCIFMENGRVVECGTYADCTKIHPEQELYSMLHDESIGKKETSDENRKDKDKTNFGSRTIPPSSFQDFQNTENAEKKATGLIEWSTWQGYGDALGGWPILLLFFIIFALTQAALLLTVVEVGKWSEQLAQYQNSGRWLGVIFGCTATVIFLSFLRATSSFFVLVRASNRLHTKLLRAVMRAKIEFFDINPIGRILNRFSADTGISDEILPLTIFDFLVGCFMAIGTVCTAVVVLPFVLLALPPLIWRFWRLRQMFVAATREIKRLEGISRSPCFATMSESAGGIGTIRSNGFIPYCNKKFEAFHDAHTRAFFAFVAASRWFAFKMDGIAFCLVALSSLLAVLFHYMDWFSIDPTVLGLALSMLLQLAGTNFPWMIRQSAEVVNQMVSVERILEYSKAPSEAPLCLSSDKAHEDWPVTPSVCFDTFSARYRDNLPLVLSNISFEIGAGMKVGVVGRSGGGKSSTVQSLFRLLEADGGSITVDDINISSLGLHKLRTAISVIPQSPFLFSNSTIRENLDPFARHKDSAICDALETVQMAEAVMDNLPNGLDTVLEEGGGNFSVGQRQLLCLARAILVRNSILVLDEATANVDVATSDLIHRSIDEAFQNATVIAVAHRLEAVLHYDRVLVLGNGQVLEYGSPTELLGNENGHFAAMVRAQGISVYE